MEQDPYEKLVETNKKIADKEDELRRVRSLKRDQEALSLAGRSDKELDILMFQAKELSADIQETKEELAKLERTRDNLTQLLMATRPMQMLLRESRRFLKQSKERSLTLTLETKPPYDPAGSGTPINRDLLVASAWHYFVVGKALAAPGEVDQDKTNAVEKQTQRTADAVAQKVDPRRNVRHIGLIGGSSGMGKTHLGLDVWYYRDKLDQPRFAKAAADAGVRKADWADVCSVARGTRVCCINFNGGTPWSAEDVAFVKLSPWYKATYPDDGVKLEPGAKVVPDAHLLPVYLRVLWGLMPQADMSYDSFSQMALAWLEVGRITAKGIIAEARAALSAHRHAVIVDELTLATMQAGDRRLSELYRHVICTFKASVLFLSLSFLFVRAEVDAESSEVSMPHGGLPPGTVVLRTPGGGGDGSPWNLEVVGQLTPRGVPEIKENLLPVASERTVYSPRSVGGSNYVAAEDVAEALANLSGGHMRSYAFLRDELNWCRADVTLWSVVKGAFEATGMTRSINNLMRFLVFFPGLLVAGLLPCTVRGAAGLPIDGDGAPPVGFSMTFDDAISRNLLCGSPDTGGVYKDPSLPPSMILALTTEWEDALWQIKEEAMGYQVSPVVRNILRSCSRMLSAADVADPGRGWELTCFWAEVMMSHVRHGAERFLMGTPGVSGVQDFSRVSLKDLYKGVDNLEERPVRHPLLSDVLVDATRPLTLEDKIPELITRYRHVNDVLKLSPDVLLSRAFMMVNAHLSFDVIRFLPVVDDPRPHAESSKRTNGMIAVCISCKSTTDSALSVPLELVKKGEKLLPKVFGDESWDTWQYNVVHVTICNHRRTSSPVAFLDDVRAAGRIVVVCRDQFKSIYGVGLSGIMSSAPTLHGTKVVR